MELEVTWGRAVKVWWAYLWRSVLAIVAMVIVGFVVGFIVGFILGALGVSVQTIQWMTGTLGAVAGLALSVVPIKLILGKDFGEFRLVLLAKEGRQSA